VPIRLTPAEIRDVDAVWKKAIDPNFENDATRLHALFDRRGRDVVRNHLRDLGMGDKANRDPIQVGTVPRLIGMRSVLYSRPATRSLARDEEPIPHSAPESKAFRKLMRRMQIDQVWAHVDKYRNLFRQCVVVFAESLSHQTVVSRVFEPYNVIRMPNAGAADVLDEDEAVAFCVRYAEDPKDRIYQMWQHEPDDSWRCWIVNDKGEKFETQPYPSDDPELDGRPPFDGLPAVLVTDVPLMGRAYLPVSQDRLSLALAVDAVFNDVQFLVKLEGHTTTVYETDSDIPDQTGPDKNVKLPPGSKAYNLNTDPKIEDAGRTVERMQAALALGESLPIDSFSPQRQVLTGASLMVAERDLERERTENAPHAAFTEQQAYRKYAAVANAYARELNLDPVPEDVDLYVGFASPTAYQDVKQQQDVSLRELAIGTTSKLRHVAAMNGMSLDDARVLLSVIDAEREEFPIQSTVELVTEGVSTESRSVSVQDQNPAALVKGPKVPGVDNAKTPGALNPDLGTASEGASVTDLAQRRS
jgi:hypothetical protein